MRFRVGDQVTIRFGKYQGTTGSVLKCQEAGVYTVKTADGSVLFFAEKGLEKEAVKIPA